jgi:hypothetical protein
LESRDWRLEIGKSVIGYWRTEIREWRLGLEAGDWKISYWVTGEWRLII